MHEFGKKSTFCVPYDILCLNMPKKVGFSVKMLTTITSEIIAAGDMVKFPVKPVTFRPIKFIDGSIYNLLKTMHNDPRPWTWMPRFKALLWTLNYSLIHVTCSIQGNTQIHNTLSIKRMLNILNEQVYMYKILLLAMIFSQILPKKFHF